MANLGFAKVNALPGTLAANTLYMIPSATAGIFDMHLSDSTGTAARHIISKSDIETMVAGAIGDFSNLRVFADITERDAFVPTRNEIGLVLDAADDATVTTGAAMYVYDNESAVKAWKKVSEIESMDLQLTWAALQDKPTSTVAAIDGAVGKAHTHANALVVDALSEVDGTLAYKGSQVGPVLGAVEW